MIILFFLKFLTIFFGFFINFANSIPVNEEVGTTTVSEISKENSDFRLEFYQPAKSENEEEEVELLETATTTTNLPLLRAEISVTSRSKVSSVLQAAIDNYLADEIDDDGLFNYSLEDSSEEGEVTSSSSEEETQQVKEVKPINSTGTVVVPQNYTIIYPNNTVGLAGAIIIPPSALVNNNDRFPINLSNYSFPPTQNPADSVLIYDITTKPLINHYAQGRADCSCGVKGFRNSGDIKINDFPWFGAVVTNRIFGGGRPHCAATLINDRYVLTASHCMDGYRKEGMQVWLTAHDNLRDSDKDDRGVGTLKLDIEQIFIHPNYDPRTKDNDIALIKLANRVDISTNSYFVPVCLPSSPNQEYSGQSGTIMGWNNIESTPQASRIHSNRICRDFIPVIKNQVCDRDTRHQGQISSNMLCAGFLTQNRIDSCVADAGGPLVIPNGGRNTLIGVVSWSYGRHRDYSPTVFSRVAGYADWILHNTRDADWCGIR